MNNNNFYGYAGCQLRVNLTDQKITTEKLDERKLRKYIGGCGYSAKLLYDELIPGIDPLSGDNKIIFATSPLSLNKVPGGGSVMVCFKSPATGGWGEARCGSDFGPDMKRSGFDFIIIEGASDEPVYLLVDDGKAELKKAGHLTGKKVHEKISMIRSENKNDKLSIACIGIGGENQVSFASIMLGGRAAGRGGGGAVMGAKKLLAVAVYGTKEIIPYNKEQFTASVKKTLAALKAHGNSSGFREFGTMGDMAGNDESGDWPTKNWRSNSWGKGEEIFNKFQSNNFIKHHGCYRGCPVACGRILSVKDGPHHTPVYEGGEYESISVFTAYVLNEDTDIAVHCDYLCNQYGIDTISCGAVIAFAMECYEKGFLNSENCDGLDLSWGNSSILPTLVEKIAQREGLGDILARGVKAASELLGNETKKYAIHVKGLEGPAHDPRSGKALAITYGSSNRGMCHIHPVEAMAYDSGKMDWGMSVHGIPDPEGVDRWGEDGKGAIVKKLQDGLCIPDVLSTCKFMMYCGVTLENWSEMLGALTGWDITGEELLQVGERVINIQRLFNCRENISKKDDRLPERLFELPEFGAYSEEKKCIIKNYDKMMEEYYKARLWDTHSGEPTKEILGKLDII